MSEQEIKEEKRKAAGKYFCVIVGQNLQFDCVLAAENKKDLQHQIKIMAENYKHNGMEFNIAAIIKGKEVGFKHIRVLEFE